MVRFLRDHLRVCGADYDPDTITVEDLGSPPRVRSRLVEELLAGLQGGITSACAEQTTAEQGKTLLDGDHLRVCGAD